MAQTPRTINLDAPSQSKISSLELFPEWAEVTRRFSVDLEEGMTQLIISRLPNSLNLDTLSVAYDKGTGASTHAISVSKREQREPRGRKKVVEQALGRCNHTKMSLNNYFGSINPETLVGGSLQYALDSYRATFENTVKEEQELEEELESIQAKEREENGRSQDLIVTITVHVPQPGKTSLSVIYAAQGVTCQVKYIINVEEKKEAPDGWADTGSLLYLAAIVNNTGELWVNMPYIRIHTTSPDLVTPMSLENQLGLESPKASKATITENTFFLDPDKPAPIPSDGNYHELTLVKIDFKPKFTLFVAPKFDNRVYLKASFKNLSSWGLLPGVARVFISNHFSCQAQINEVHQGEYFECPLRVETGIQVWTSERSSSEGPQQEGHALFRERTLVIKNERSTSVRDLCVVDIARDLGEEGTLIEPALQRGTRERIELYDDDEPLRSVYAQWDEKLEFSRGEDIVKSLDEEGKIRWVCSLGPGAAVQLKFEWACRNPQTY